VDEALIAEMHSHASGEDRENFWPSTREGVRHSVSADGQNWFVVENEKRKAVGTISVVLKHSIPSGIVWKLAFPTLKGQVSRAFILPEHRGKGYYGAAVMEIEHVARKHGVKKLVGLIHRKNTRSQRGVQKAGFSEDKWLNLRLSVVNQTGSYYHQKSKTNNPLIAFSKKIKRP